MKHKALEETVNDLKTSQKDLIRKLDDWFDKLKTDLFAKSTVVIERRMSPRDKALIYVALISGVFSVIVTVINTFR